MKQNIAPKISGTVAQITFSANTSTNAPTMYVNKIPVMINTWKNVPTTPRISFSAISEEYCGADTQKAPPARPMINLPDKSTGKFLAKITISHPTMKGITKPSIVVFRPNFFIRKPTGRHEIAAPSVMIEATQSNWVCDKEKFPPLLLIIAGPAGAGHPKAAPVDLIKCQ